MNPLVIPRVFLPAKHCEEFSKSTTRVLIHQRQKRLYYRLITTGVRLVAVSSAADFNCTTSHPDAHPMLIPDEIYQSPLLRRL